LRIFEVHWVRRVTALWTSSNEISCEISFKATDNWWHFSEAIFYYTENCIFKKNEIKIFTEVNRVNWFVVSVNWTNDDDCKIILFEPIIVKLVVKFIKYSRIFA
jgi:hypothetical protein